MMQDIENDNKKRRAVANSTLLTRNGCSDYDIINYQTKSNKWTLQELISLIENQGYTESDILKFYNQRRHQKLMKLVSSDWFAIFLTYLDIKEIVRLDSAFCSYVDRPSWLTLLKTFEPSISLCCNRSTIEISEWLIRKYVHPKELSLQ